MIDCISVAILRRKYYNPFLKIIKIFYDLKFIEKFRNQEGRDGESMYNLTIYFVRVIVISEFRILAFSLRLTTFFSACLDGQYFYTSSRKRYIFF